MDDQAQPPLAVVSGAAKGIGKSCADAFLKRGWRVVAIDMDDRVAEVFSSDAVTAVAVDISDEAALSAAWRRIATPTTILINAAGLFPPTSLASLTVDQYRQIFDVNVLGTLLLSQLAARDMVDGGAIINFSSTNGFVARADQLIYAATKAAILSVTRSLAADLASRRIRVNAIAPGPVNTEGFRAIPGRLEEATKQAPLGRVQSPDEIGELAYWLAEGDGAQFITGETIVCSGGLFMR